MKKEDEWLPYMPLFVGDYLSVTTHLTTEEHGALLLLMITSWRSAGELALDNARLARIAKVEPRRWSVVWAAISEFFDVEEGKITHRLVAEQFLKSVALRESARERGRRGAEARWQRLAEASTREQVKANEQ